MPFWTSQAGSNKLNSRSKCVKNIDQLGQRVELIADSASMAAGPGAGSSPHRRIIVSRRPENPVSAGATVRWLLRTSRKAALATIGGGGDESPYSSPRGYPATALTAVAAAWDGSPILLLSQLAVHTRNLAADSRASLLFDGTAGFANPQAGPRASLVGRIAPAEDERLGERYLAYHPDARLYAGFGDFAFYRMEVENVHFVGGFARAMWLAPRKVLSPKGKAARIAEIEAGVIAHMNADHADAVSLYGARLLGKRGKRWTMIGIDPDGCDLRCGMSVHRLAFDQPVEDAKSCREALVALAKKARNPV